MNTRLKKAYPGVGIIEVIGILAIVTIGLFALNELIAFNFGVTSKGIFQERALALAQEGVEVMTILRNQSWSGEIDSLIVGTSYYPQFNSGTNTWSLTTTPPPLINGIFNRSIVIEDVYRDASNNIATSGTLDPNTKKITVTVSWTSQGQIKTVTVPTYLTNFLNN